MAGQQKGSPLENEPGLRGDEERAPVVLCEVWWCVMAGMQGSGGRRKTKVSASRALAILANSRQFSPSGSVAKRKTFSIWRYFSASCLPLFQGVCRQCLQQASSLGKKVAVFPALKNLPTLSVPPLFPTTLPSSLVTSSFSHSSPLPFPKRQAAPHASFTPQKCPPKSRSPQSPSTLCFPSPWPSHPLAPPTGPPNCKRRASSLPPRRPLGALVPATYWVRGNR